MLQEVFNRIFQLLCIKSLTTLILIITASYLVSQQIIVPDWYQGAVMLVIGFYFGTQVSKVPPTLPPKDDTIHE